MSFWALLCEILGRIMAASDDAFKEAVPGGECSLRVVVPAAMQELGYVRACDHLLEGGVALL